MDKDIQKILLTQSQIQSRVAAMGREITKDYEGKSPLLVGVLKGCFVFMADLIRQIPLYCDVDFMVVSSYGNGTSTTGAVSIDKDLSQDIEGRDVIIVEDILDSGLTLNYLTGYLRHRQPASIRIATLLDKPARRRASVKADYVGFQVEDDFVVGYGLDYGQRYRNLPYIGILRPEIYQTH